MTESDSYHDPVAHEEDFNDSVILRPISLKPTVVPSILGRSNPQNTILAAYDKIKLTQFIQSSQQGSVIQLISLQPKSFLTILSPQGIEFLQRFSGTDIAFIMVTGQKGSGKSFFIDKVLNLSNVQGNNFSIAPNQPAINIWSKPFVKQDLKIFIAQVSGCDPGSKQFDMLLPYMTILSSVIVNMEQYKQKSEPNSYQKLDKKLNKFLEQFYSQSLNQNQNKNEILNSIFPKIVYNVNRNTKELNLFNQRSQIRAQQYYLPNAKNPQYRGIDQDLRVHSFLNKKCINEQYIYGVSQLFNKIFVQIQQKKHRQLVFNGGIVLKYLGQLSLLFHKGYKIDIGKVYYDIVKDLYISAYNYCVISYHQLLESALSDQKPRSLEQLIEIFQRTSNQILQKYNQFSLQKSIHEEYQQKLQRHIESKQKLIMQINRKKTQIELNKIYQQNANMNDLNQTWNTIKIINTKYPNYTHARDQVMGKKLSQIILRLNTGNNVDYIIKRQIQKIGSQLKDRKQQLQSIKQYNRKNKTQADEKNRAGQNQKQNYMSSLQKIQKHINQVKRQMRMYQNIQLMDPSKLKQELNQIDSKYHDNQRILENLHKEVHEPIQNLQSIRDLNNKIEEVKNKYLIQQLTFKQIQSSSIGNEGGMQDVTQANLKKENNPPNKKQPSGQQPSKSNINASKNNKKASK